MTKSLTRTVKHELEDTLEDVAKTLRQAADGLSHDAEKAVAEAKAHPIATAAAALSAAAALITIIGVTRRKTA